MPGYTDDGTRHYLTDNAIDLHLRVQLDSNGELEVAGAGDREIGTLLQKSTGTTNESVSVRDRKAQGTHLMVAAAAIAANAYVFGAAAGKIDDADNGNPIGIALNAATADGDLVEVRRIDPSELPADLGLFIDDDFIGDFPAAATALSGQGAYNWAKTETNGLGVISSDEANGVLKFSFDAVNEAATATLFMENSPIDPTKGGTAEFIVGIFDIGDDAALDIDFGLALNDNATNFDAMGERISIHLDGGNLSLVCKANDGSNNTGIDSAVDVVDDTYYVFKIDWNDLSDVKFYYRAIGATTWTRLASGTTFDASDLSSTLTPIVMVEKTTNDTTADVRVDRITVASGR